MKKILFLLAVISFASCQNSGQEAKPLSATAEAIKTYKLNFEWQNGYEGWSKVPTTEDYHMVAPGLNLEATGAEEINEIIFGFCTETELVQELVDITEHGNYITCYLKLTTKTGESFDGVEVFQVDDKGRVAKILYGGMVFVDIVVANIWMALLLIGIGKRKRINSWLKADTTAIEELKERVSSFTESVKRNPSLTDLMIMVGIAFGTVSFAHFGAGYLAPLFDNYISGIESTTARNIFTFLGSSFFWMISISTLVAIALSFSKAKNYEGTGASKFGSVFIYILVATIGMKMDLKLIFDNTGLIAIGVVWMSIHALLLILVAKLIKAPYFFLAVGSQANVGGAASAPIVASAFHPSLATVGVLLAVFGYAIGTVAAIGCTILMTLAAATS